ncbi:MAG: CoA transferase [Dehalococcoidales bacterium]|nr:CoA transferase [Dehalococcoidales bacterium]
MKSALNKIKVIEYGSYITAPYCSKLLADMGAEVIKIEEPVQGDISRKVGPFLKDTPGPDRSGFFLYLNNNKRGITLNIQKPTGADIFRKLLCNADVLIEDTMPGTLETLNLGAKDLKQMNEKLVITSITGFGQTGPYKKYKATDLIAWSMGGAGYVTPRWCGSKEQEPLRASQTGSFMTGISAACATMSALIAQRRDGLGQQVDISLFESIVLLIAEVFPSWTYVHRSNTRASRPEQAPQHFLRCKNGWVFLHADEAHHWERFVHIMGDPDWAKSELFADWNNRAQYWDSLQPLIESYTTQHTKAELFALGKANRIPFAPSNNAEEVVKNPQFRERNFFVEVEHPVAGKLEFPGFPYQFSETPGAIRRPAPLLGQHNVEVYCDELGYTREELVKLNEAGII